MHFTNSACHRTFLLTTVTAWSRLERLVTCESTDTSSRLHSNSGPCDRLKITVPVATRLRFLPVLKYSEALELVGLAVLSIQSSSVVSLYCMCASTSVTVPPVWQFSMTIVIKDFYGNTLENRRLLVYWYRKACSMDLSVTAASRLQ